MGLTLLWQTQVSEGSWHQIGTCGVRRARGRRPVDGIRRWGTEAKGAIGIMAWSYGVEGDGFGGWGPSCVFTRSVWKNSKSKADLYHLSISTSINLYIYSFIYLSSISMYLPISLHLSILLSLSLYHYLPQWINQSVTPYLDTELSVLSCYTPRRNLGAHRNQIKSGILWEELL